MLDEHVAVAMPRAIVTAEPEPGLPRKRQADTSTTACATALVDLPSHARVSPERQSDDETAVPDEWVAPPAAASGSDESLLDEDNTPCPTSVEASPIQPPAKVGRDLSDTAAAATAAADAVQQALMAVKQERDVLTEREHALKRQRSKADSRARRRQRMLRLGEHDPVTQELRLRQIQQDQYYQSHRQGTMRPPQSRAARESSVGGLLEDALAEFQHVQQLRRPSVPSMSFFPNGGMHPATMPPAMMMAPAGDAWNSFGGPAMTPFAAPPIIIDGPNAVTPPAAPGAPLSWTCNVPQQMLGATPYHAAPWMCNPAMPLTATTPEYGTAQAQQTPAPGWIPVMPTWGC